jgi:hypothetical protein
MNMLLNLAEMLLHACIPAYVNDSGAKDCVAFTVEIDAASNAVCNLKSKAVAAGEKCPDGYSCVSGQL